MAPGVLLRGVGAANTQCSAAFTRCQEWPLRMAHTSARAIQWRQDHAHLQDFSFIPERMSGFVKRHPDGNVYRSITWAKRKAKGFCLFLR